VQAPYSNQPKNQVLKHQSLKLFYFDMQLKKKIELMIYFFFYQSFWIKSKMTQKSLQLDNIIDYKA